MKVQTIDMFCLKCNRKAFDICTNDTNKKFIIEIMCTRHENISGFVLADRPFSPTIPTKREGTD